MNDIEWWIPKWREGEPCSHPGCLSHISHPCEGCGRIGGEYPEHPCRLCDGFIQAGEDESKWGLDWYKGYVHFSCIENIFDATRRMRNKPELAKLEAENEALKRDYYELIMVVSEKYEGETRHETALRYITERENQDARVAMSNKERGDGQTNVTV